MKRILCFLTALLCMTALLAACGEAAKTPATTEALCEHQWCEPGCYTPKICDLCGATEGGPVHQYQLAADECVYPSCTENGVNQYYCAICDDPDMEEVPATGHTVSDGICTECGAEVQE